MTFKQPLNEDSIELKKFTKNENFMKSPELCHAQIAQRK